jgi:hypothetical protein
MFLYPVPSGENVDQSTLSEVCQQGLFAFVIAVKVLPENLDVLVLVFTMRATDPSTMTPARQVPKHQFHKGMKIPTIELPFLYIYTH